MVFIFVIITTSTEKREIKTPKKFYTLFRVRVHALFLYINYTTEEKDIVNTGPCSIMVNKRNFVNPFLLVFFLLQYHCKT